MSKLIIKLHEYLHWLIVNHINQEEYRPCSNGNGGCSQVCKTSYGRSTCSCRPGYALNSDGYTCFYNRKCTINNGGCMQRCVVDKGASKCACQSGYRLNADEYTCTDINECNLNNCDHTCTNTPGSFRCSCKQGFILQSDGHTCIDTDECLVSTHCEQDCHNLLGAYTCSCREGYTLQPDLRSCTEINECLTSNGGCSHICRNDPGSFHCECKSGYKLSLDRRSCTDIDECATSTSKCTDTCYNTPGNYTCSCNYGFSLQTDGHTCKDIDDCIGVTCQNGGVCVDNIGSFTCSCKKGFTGTFCEKDYDECSGHFKGGCEDICNNTPGSYKCACSGNTTLKADGFSCLGGGSSVSLFERNNIVGHILPRGCSTVLLSRCTSGHNISLLLSSTSPWFQLKTDSSIVFSFGLVFVELNELSVPISLTGMEVVIMDSEFKTNIGSLSHTQNDGIKISTERKHGCLSFNITPRDIRNIISSVSFVKTFFKNLGGFLPDWLKFSYEGNDIIELYDLKSDILHGADVKQDVWCKGAPIFDDHLYTVFKFESDMAMSVYGNKIILPKPIQETKFCFVIDICQDYGGSVFLMLPPQSRDVLMQFDMIKTLSRDIHIYTHGIGLSIVKHVRVNSRTSALHLWNGDRMFDYRIFRSANFWIGGEMKMDFKVLELKANADLYVSVPSIKKLLKGAFIEEWDVFVDARLKTGLKLKFKLFGKDHVIHLKLANANAESYASLGGTIVRQWCGETANPSGLFMSVLLDVNPFHDVPILKYLNLDLTANVYAFFASDPGSKVSSADNIDILQDIFELNAFLKDYISVTIKKIGRYGIILGDTSMDLLENFNRSTKQLIYKTDQALLDLQHFDLKQYADFMSSTWSDGIAKIQADSQEFIDSLEFNTRVATYNFTELLNHDINEIQDNFRGSINKLRNQVMPDATDYNGFGLRFKTDLNIFNLKLLGVELEFVNSINRLGECSKYKEVFKIFKNEKAIRFFGVLSSDLVQYGYFLRGAGEGFGMALSTELPEKIAVRLHLEANIIGIKATTDLFISNKGINFYIEGKLGNRFMVQIHSSAEHGNNWYALEFRLQGKLLGNAGNDNSFGDSYLGALGGLASDLAKSANKRISQLQDIFTDAQHGLTSAQNWLEDRKSDIPRANKAFDIAVKDLDKVKDKLEECKIPFQRAINALNSAQRHLDRLCKIKHCSKVCIKGISCKICWKRVWSVKVRYPCCHFTSCKISFPNPLCVLANLACTAIRAIAYVALEAAKLFVRVPMLALDAAKLVVSVAQVVVDKSRVVLDVALVAIDIAQFGLEGVKGVFEIAKLALEGVKLVVQIASNVFNLIIKYGLQSIIDVRNCGFDIDVATTKLPVFEVSCEVNAFHLGWIQFGFGINFNNIFQTIWQAAKSTITALFKMLGNLSERRKRELYYDTVSNTHKFIRLARSDGNYINDEQKLNETIQMMLKPTGFKNSTNGSDYVNRLEIFQQKCTDFKLVYSFIYEANSVLLDIVNETKSVLDNVTDLHTEMDGLNFEELQNSLTLEGTGVDPDVAMREFNISQEELNAAMQKANDSLKDDPLLKEINSLSGVAKTQLKSHTDAIEKLDVSNHWIIAMENITKDYFDEDQCVSFLDCAHYSVSILYELQAAENLTNTTECLSAISSIEELFLDLTGNSSHTLTSIHKLTSEMDKQFRILNESNIFCSEAPTMVSPLSNQTVTRGSSAVFVCNVTGDPYPAFWWYRGEDVIPGETGMILTIDNVTDEDAAMYKCIAGNIVANLSFDESHVIVKEDDIPMPTMTNVDGVSINGSTENNVPLKVSDDTTLDMSVVIAATVSSAVFVLLIAALVVWRTLLRHKFRNGKLEGSFASLNMVKPMAAKRVFVTTANKNNGISEMK